MNLKTFKADVFDEDTIKKLCTTKPEISYKKIFDNDILVDTAGFVPLDVRIKQFLVSGEQAKISAEMFDSDDWRYMYEHINENTLEVGDDIEDVSLKLANIVAKRNEILARKAGLNFSDTPDQASAEKQSDKQASAGSVTEKSENAKA